jgi:hypothetical protein
MKTLLKLAMGAAIAGALVNALMKRGSGRGMESRDTGPTMDQPEASGFQDENPARGTAGFTVGELATDTNSVGSEQSARGQQPQEWRGAQNVLDS